MPKVGKARVFMSGRSQAVRIPAAYRFASEEVFIRRDLQTGEIILSEKPIKPSFAEVFAMIDAAGGAEDLLADRDISPPQEREWM
jgi:antitoxin VapB